MAESGAFWVKTEDWHTAGEPFRIVSELPAHCKTQGNTVAERRQNILKEPNHPIDILRQSLCHEPRGHADMYGGFIVPPDDPGAHFGVLFWHKDGFSTACGHGTIALGRWAVAKGIVKSVQEGSVEVVIDVPSGRVKAHVAFLNGTVTHVDFVNVASYQHAKDLPITVSLNGASIELKTELSWGGAMYASINVQDLDLQVEPKNYLHFLDIAAQIKARFRETANYAETYIYGVIFFSPLSDSSQIITQKNITVYAEGSIDRSPCGSGTCARIAILLAQGKLDLQKRFVHYSVIDTGFEGKVLEVQGYKEGFPVCVPRVRGNAALTGRHEFFVDPEDGTFPGFLIR